MLVAMKRTAIGIIFNNDRREVLLIKRCDIPIWVLPGGGVEEGEAPQDAVIREVKEETGLDVAVSRQSGQYSPITRRSNPVWTFECTIQSGTPQTGEETRDIGFFPIDKLPKVVFHLHEEWIKDALKSDKEIIKNPIEGVSLFKLFWRYCRYPTIILRGIFVLLGRPINTSPKVKNQKS